MSPVNKYLLNANYKESQQQLADWMRKNAGNVEIEAIKPESLMPVTTENRSPICFSIKSMPNSYIDGKNIFISVKFKVQKLDGDSCSVYPAPRIRL
jgi:hypothetical protein